MSDTKITPPAVGPCTPGTRASVQRRRELLRRLARLGVLTGTLLLASASGSATPLTDAFEKSVRSVVVAAGNESRDPCDKNLGNVTPSKSAQKPSQGVLAHLPQEKCQDIVAPGADVLSMWLAEKASR